ncbi:MAG TPA: hypothetical protein VGG10_14290 [Rhizomicrobium sp.]|jgi:hypothetical protein
MLTIYMPQGASFQLINTIVAQLEGADGPLTGLAIERRATVLLFDETAPKPTVFAKVQPASDARPPGAERVCSGKIIVACELTDCVAYRS